MARKSIKTFDTRKVFGGESDKKSSALIKNPAFRHWSAGVWWQSVWTLYANRQVTSDEPDIPISGCETRSSSLVTENKLSFR